MGTTSAQSFDLVTDWQSRTCKSFQDYLERAYEKQEQQGHAHAFRGVSAPYGNLLPSLDRLDIGDRAPIKAETYFLEEFILRTWNYLTPQERERFEEAEKRWHTTRNTGTLVLARHRLVPTRCVDWSYCPLIALFIACETDSASDGEVWWFDRVKFDKCVEKQWPDLFGKVGNVEADIEIDFIKKCDEPWFTALDYTRLPGDRPDRQKAWITSAGRLGTCHAKEIHRLQVRQKGRFVIPSDLKLEAIRELERRGITRESLGLNHDDPADRIAKQIKRDFEKDFPAEDCAKPCNEKA